MIGKPCRVFRLFYWVFKKGKERKRNRKRKKRGGLVSHWWRSITWICANYFFTSYRCIFCHYPPPYNPLYAHTAGMAPYMAMDIWRCHYSPDTLPCHIDDMFGSPGACAYPESWWKNICALHVLLGEARIARLRESLSFTKPVISQI